MDLHELFDEVITEDEPPTSLSADQAYRAGRRRATIKTAFTGTAAAAALVAVVAGATTMVGGSSRPAHAPPSASPSPSTLKPQLPAGPGLSGVHWASAWDAQHLYAGVRQHCQDVSTCTEQLLGSDDGGRTWTVRSDDPELIDTHVIGPQTLMSAKAHELPQSPPGRLSEPDVTYQLSNDGGRHWADLTISSQAVTAVPTGGYLMCIGDNGLSCAFYAVDPAHLRAAPLTTVPAGLSDNDGMGPQAASGPLWAVGDVASGIVSASADAGRTWHSTTLDPSCPTYLSVTPGGQPGTAGALCDAASSAPLFHVYRTTDSGATWQPVVLPKQQPFGAGPDEMHAFLLRDGTVVVVRYPIDDSGIKLWTLAPGGTSWQPVPITGLPAYAVVLEYGHDGTVLAYASLSDHVDVYRTTDLRTWSLMTLVAPR